MIQFIERRHPEKIAPYCEFIGISSSQIECMETYIKSFQENGGSRLFLKARDFELELQAMDLEN